MDCSFSYFSFLDISMTKSDTQENKPTHMSVSVRLV